MKEAKQLSISAIAGILSGFINNAILPGLTSLPHIILGVFIFGLCLYIFRAYQSMTTTRRALYPVDFWGMIFGMLPTNKGENMSTSPARSIVVVNWKSTFLKEINKLQKEFKGLDSIDFKLTDIIISNNTSEVLHTLGVKLKGAGGIIMFRCAEFENYPEVYELIDRWCFDNSHVPCLVVDKIDPLLEKEIKTKLRKPLSEIPNKFNIVDIDNPKEIPWWLTTRAGQRSELWKSLALYIRVCALVAGIGLLICGYFTYSAVAKNINLSQEISKLNEQREIHELLANAKNDIYEILPADVKISDLKIAVWEENNKNEIERLHAVGKKIKIEQDCEEIARKDFLISKAFQSPGIIVIAFPDSNQLKLYNRNDELCGKRLDSARVKMNDITFEYVVTVLNGKKDHSAILCYVYQKTSDFPKIGITVDTKTINSENSVSFFNDKYIKIHEIIRQLARTVQSINDRKNL